MLNISEEDFEKLYGKPKPTKDTKIIFSCRSGRRSKMVQEEMQKLGYTRYAEVVFLKIAIEISRIFISVHFADLIIIVEDGRIGKANRKTTE